MKINAFFFGGGGGIQGQGSCGIHVIFPNPKIVIQSFLFNLLRKIPTVLWKIIFKINLFKELLHFIFLKDEH